jgi:hypothetical protein
MVTTTGGGGTEVTGGGGSGGGMFIKDDDENQTLDFLDPSVGHTRFCSISALTVMLLPY